MSSKQRGGKKQNKQNKDFSVSIRACFLLQILLHFLELFILWQKVSRQSAIRKSGASLSQRKDERSVRREGWRWGGVYSPESRPTLVQTGSCPLPLPPSPFLQLALEPLHQLFFLSTFFLFPFHFTSSFFFLSLLLINTLSFSPVFHLLTFWQQEYLFFLLMVLKM